MIFTLYVVISTSARGRMTPGMIRGPGASERGCVPLGAGSAVARPHRMARRIRNCARRSGGRCCGWLSRHTALRNALPRGGADHLRSSVNVRFLTMRIPRDRQSEKIAGNINSLNHFGVKSAFQSACPLFTTFPSYDDGSLMPDYENVTTDQTEAFHPGPGKRVPQYHSKPQNAHPVLPSF